MIAGNKDDSTGRPQYRTVINYEALNDVTMSPKYPLPTVQKILDMLTGAQVLTTVDMEQGFRQVLVDPLDQYETAFRACMGRREFEVMPFGPRKAPCTFQSVMKHMVFLGIARGVIICERPTSTHARC